jgi:threonine synthase
MDIQQASNFERWLWWYFDGDSKKLVETMENLRRSGSFRENGIPAKNDIIRAASCNDAGIKATINHVWRTTGYIPDPHTACAFAALSNEMRNVVTATAHPAKFPDTIVAATGQTPKHPSLEQLKERQLVKTTLPANVDAVKNEIRKIMSSE